MPEMPKRKVRIVRPGLHVYDPETHWERSEDALGNVTEAHDGRTYISGFQRVRCEMASGDELEIVYREHDDAIEIRNNGRTLRSAISVVPVSSNVVRVMPFD